MKKKIVNLLNSQPTSVCEIPASVKRSVDAGRHVKTLRESYQLPHTSLEQPEGSHASVCSGRLETLKCESEALLAARGVKVRVCPA